MPVASNEMLAPNFSAKELGADLPYATDAIVANLRRVATYLQLIRAVLSARMGYEVPLKINSGLRSREHNLEVGGSPTSNHMDGLAADFVPLNTKRPAGAKAITMYMANRILTDAIRAGELPTFDQFIYYPIQGHIHIGIGSRSRHEILIRVAENKYAALSDDLLDRLPGFADGLAQVGSALSAVVDNQVSWFPVIAFVLILFIVLQ